MLEKAYRDQLNGKAPMFPVWLSPVQVRVIPVSERFIPDAEKIADELGMESHRIRVDVDDRPLTLQKKIREAEMEWIPYIVVVGRREVESGVLAVRDRQTEKVGKPAEIKKMSLKELVEEIKNQTRGKPFKPLALPRALSQRPRFFG